ncbi:MFS transporter [Actinokineospora guangxiensis]|uniref:MFS transporter n=1 Tax=Actinokineospora guangxiensis TaxID=1490288 RepID=A0ABW0EUC3_9PSEU
MSDRRAWAGLAVLVLPCLLISMDISVLFFALPFIAADLGPTGPEQLWIMDAYSFTLAGGLITMGAVGDRVGRRKLLLLGAAAFSAASVAAAYAPTAELLIAARFLLGVAGATLLPSTLSLIRTLFPDDAKRKVAIAVWTGGITIGAFIGPIAGGLLLEFFWWGSAFLINLPAMALLLALGPMLLPETRNPDAGRFDFPGAVLSMAAMLAVVYGMKKTAVEGVEPVPVAALVLGLVLAVVFLRRQRRIAYPLVDLAMFGDRTFGTAIGINLVAMFCFIGSMMFTNQYLQLVLGMRPFEAALWSLVVVPFIAVGMTVSGVLAQRLRIAPLVAGGLVVLASGFAALATLEVDSGLWVVLAGSGLVGAGVLVTTTLTGDHVLSTAPEEKVGSASALAETGTELGGALGMAVLGTVGAAVYHREMAGAVAGLPPEAAATAQDTLGGAAAVAAQTPGGEALFAAAESAFVSGLTTTAVSAAVLVLVLTVPAYRALRKVPAPRREAVAA